MSDQPEKKLGDPSPVDNNNNLFKVDIEAKESSGRIVELEHEIKQTREDLQALVKELEIINKEQEVSNEELTTVNIEFEYQSTIQELRELNNDIDNLLKSTDISVIFLDRELKIRKFTPSATEAIALRNTDVERPLDELAYKIECPNLNKLVAKVIETKQSVELEVKLKNIESYFLMRINLYQTAKQLDDGIVISFIKIDETKKVRLQLNKANNILERRIAHRTQILLNFSVCLKQLHRLSTTNYPDLASLFADYLQTGCQILNLTTGVISKFVSSTYRIAAVESPLDLAVDDQIPCNDSYCGAVVKTLKTVAYERVGAIESMGQNPVYLNYKLESFIGTPIFVNEKFYGTLSFSDTQSRKHNFSQQEIEIVELMATSLGQFIASVENSKILQARETLFRKTFEQAAVGMAHVSSTGNFLRVNQRLADMLGYSTEHLVTLTFQEISHADDLAEDYRVIQLMLTREIETCTVEKRYFHCDGSIVWIKGTVSCIRFNSGELDYFVCIIEDISDRKKTELALAQSRDKLQQASEAKDSFIARTSHELRTPLNSILGFSRVLQDELKFEPQKLNSVNIIHQSGQHLLALINDILDFSKIIAKKLELEPRVFDLILFLESIGSIFQLRAQQKGLNLEIQISPTLTSTVMADETKLRQVLFNLLSNAIKFTEKGGVILKVGYVNDFEGNFPIELPTNSSPTERPQSSALRKIRFQVEDTGKGIDATKFSEIFDPFKQLKDSADIQEGTGLGLTISQDIIQLMGGEIQLTSEISLGTKFWFDLELAPSKTCMLPAFTESVPQVPRRLNLPFKALVVDNNADNRFLLVSYLQPLGFILAEAGNGQEGLEVATSFLPDVILVDLVMPIMDGPEMIARIKQQTQLADTLIITISASSQPFPNFSNPDNHYFLPKPVDLAQLLKLLESNLPLTWELADSPFELDLSKIVVPGQEELTKLLELADLGDMEAIELQISSWELLDSQYEMFAQEIKTFAANFQQQQLESFIRKFINHANTSLE